MSCSLVACNCSKCFIFINSFNPYRSVRQVPLLSSHLADGEAESWSCKVPSPRFPWWQSRLSLQIPSVHAHGKHSRTSLPSLLLLEPWEHRGLYIAIQGGKTSRTGLYSQILTLPFLMAFVFFSFPHQSEYWLQRLWTTMKINLVDLHKKSYVLPTVVS